MRALLSSPCFLFREELGKADAAGFRLTSHEVASALSFTLTDAPPDAELRALASMDALQNAEQIRAQVLRLLATDPGIIGVRSFLGEFLGARNFVTVGKSEESFPLFDDATHRCASGLPGHDCPHPAFADPHICGAVHNAAIRRSSSHCSLTGLGRSRISSGRVPHAADRAGSYGAFDTSSFDGHLGPSGRNKPSRPRSSRF